MSIYDEAILIQKPSGYKAEKLYNVVPSPEVSEQSSVEFDGVDDELITDGDSVAQPTTYSFWAKSTETGANDGVFGHGGDSKGAFNFNGFGVHKPLLYLGSGYYRWWSDTSAQDDGEWHHWVVYSDTNDITNSKLYVDGVLQSVDSTVSGGSTSAYTEGLTIGSNRQSSGNYFNGSISDFAVFSRELNQSDVTEIYNYGSPNDLLLESSYGSDISQSSTKSVEFDGVDDYLDANITLNLPIYSVSLWAKLHAYGSNGYLFDARYNSGSEYLYHSSNNPAELSHNTPATLYVDGVIGDEITTNWHHIVITGTTLEATKIIIGARFNTWFYFNGSIDNVGIYNKALTQAEVTRQYNGGLPIDLSTDATSDSLVAYYKMGDGTLDSYPVIADQTDATWGSQLVTNGDFSSNTGGLGTDWDINAAALTPSIVDGQRITYKTSVSGYNYRIYQDAVFESNKIYQLKFSIKGNGTPVSNGIMIKQGAGGTRYGLTGLFSVTTSFVEHTLIVKTSDTATYGTPLNFAGGHYGAWSSTSDFLEIDNISVKELQGNPAAMTNMSSTDITTDVALGVVNDLESYYQMGDGILDDYPLIADQTNATLGSQLVDDVSDYGVPSGYNNTVNISSTSSFESTYVSSENRVYYNLTTVVGKIYKLSYSIATSTTGMDVYIKENANGTGSLIASTSRSTGIVTLYFTATTTTTSVTWTGADDYSLTAISVKQIQGNPAMMTNMSSDDIVAWTPNIETDFDVARSSTTTRINASGYIEDVAANVPRLNYDSDDSCPYLLTEAASTNLITYPKSFGNSYWTKSGASIEGDASIVGSELITNGDMELDCCWNAHGSGTITWSTEQARSGTHSYKVLSSSSGWAGISSPYFNTTKNKVYELKFSVYGVSGSSLLMSTYDGVEYNTFDNYTVSYTNGQWTDYTYQFTSSNTRTNGTLLFNRLSSVIEFYLDDVSVKEVQPFEAPKEKPSVASELVTNGGFDGNADDWYLGTGWAYGTNNIVATSSSDWFRQDISAMESNKNYVVTYEISNYSAGSIKWRYGTLATIDGTSRNANGTYSEYFNNTTSGDKRLFFEPSSFTGTIDNVSIKEVTDWSGGGLEREAYKLVEDTANSRHRCTTDNILTSSGNAHTLSVYAKADTRNWIALEMYGVGDRMAWFDIANGVVGTKQANITSSEIVAIANGWYRCSITLDAPGGQGMFGVFLADEDDSYSYTGENKSVYLSYLQVEESDYASSLMLPTTEGSTTSRVADEITNAGDVSLFSGVNSSGVFYLEVAANSDNLTDRFVSISDASSSNRLMIGFSNTSNIIFALGYVSNSIQFVMNYTLTDMTDFHKVAVRYAENDFSFWIDGVERATDTSGSTFAADTLTECNFDVGGGSDIYGKTKALAVFDYLSDDQMVKLTEEGYDTFNALATANNFIIR